MQRPTYKIAKDKGGTWEFLVDAIESTTTYHREPSDVKVKVGPIGYLGLAMMGALGGYMVYLAFTTNVYLSESAPMYSSFAHWPTGGTSAQTADEQYKEGSMCTYQEKYDYWYGKPPGVWNYAGNTCEIQSYTEYSFKATNSLHLVTYEQRRTNVRVPLGKHGPSCDGMAGDALSACEETSCDLACQTDGYGEWPTAAQFRADEHCEEGSTDCWLSVHVATEAHNRLKVKHPDLPAKPQMHLRMPQLSGGDCTCYSLENVFVLGVDDAMAHFTHGFEAYDGQEMGSFKLSKEEDKNAPTSFLLARGPNANPLPFKVIESAPGMTVSFTVREALEALGTCLDCPGPSSMWDNGLCPETGECTGNYQLEPTPRMSGMTLTVRTLYFNNKKTTPDTYAVIRDNYPPPYAIHTFSSSVEWTSRGSDVVTEISTPDLKKDVDRYRYGVLIKYVPAAGVISRFDFNVIIQTLVNFTVLLGFPPMLMSAIVFVGLGRKSKLYRRGQRKTLTLEGMHRSFAYNAVIAGAIFSNLDEDGDGFLDGAELERAFKNLLEPKLRTKFKGESQDWYDARLKEFVHFMSDSFHVDIPEEGAPKSVEAGQVRVGISHTEFVSNCLRNEPLNWDDMMEKLIDPSIDADPELPCRKRKKSTNKVSPIGSDNFSGPS
jgi:hypothetical protein